MVSEKNTPLMVLDAIEKYTPRRESPFFITRKPRDSIPESGLSIPRPSHTIMVVKCAH